MALSRLDILYTWKSVKWPQVALSAREVAYTEYVETSVQPKKECRHEEARSHGHDCIDGLRRDGVGSRNGIQRDVVRHSKTQCAVLHIGPYSVVFGELGYPAVRKHVRAVEERERALRGLRPHYAREV